jgi:hypothetical protein
VIRVERDEEGRRGQYRWHCRAYDTEGVSRQPLLDACRALERMGVDPAETVGLFRGKSAVWDLRCSVAYGAKVSVVERDRGAIRLESFHERI